VSGEVAKYCSNCGTPITKEAAQYCAYCGANL
ncbi:MAG: zinc-ribbon domain-containing protein, partial [Promethearchaeota archaeon]